MGRRECRVLGEVHDGAGALAGHAGELRLSSHHASCLQAMVTHAWVTHLMPPHAPAFGHASVAVTGDRAARALVPKVNHAPRPAPSALYAPRLTRPAPRAPRPTHVPRPALGGSLRG